MRTKRYEREADMLAPIKKQASHFLPGREIETLFEVQTAAGIPDIVCVDFNKPALSRRVASSQSFIVDFADICVLLALTSTTTETVSSATLANRVPLSAKYMSSVILPRLREYGHVEKESRGRWRSVSQYETLADYVGTIEVKISDWRSGYSQTLRHRASADESWLVVDSTHSAPATAHHEWFTRAGIGLATLDSHDGIQTAVSPTRLKHRTRLNAYRELLAERAAHLYSNGEVSGTIGLVFGVDLTTTTGPDPRRPNVGGHHRTREAAVHSATA